MRFLLDKRPRGLYNLSMDERIFPPLSLILDREHLFVVSSTTRLKPEYHTEHAHRGNYELYIFLAGAAEMRIEGERFAMRENELLIIPPNTKHIIHIIDTERYERIIFNVSDEYIKGLGLEFFSVMLRELAKKPIDLAGTPFMESVRGTAELAAVVRHGETQKILYDERIISLFSTLFTLYRRLKNPESQSVLGRILAYIDDNEGKLISLKTMSAELFLSQSYICKIFKEKMGVPIMHYIMRRRIARAKNLITTGMPLKQVCYECGFTNYVSFFRLFRTETGQTPSAYAKSVKNIRI